MKFLLALFFILSFLSTSSFATEIFHGQFELAQAKYELKLTYSFAKNQVATDKQIRFFEETTFPETNETIPAFCYFEMKFPFQYSVEITESSTGTTVFRKSGVELLNTYTSGGFVSEGNCVWNILDWKKEITSTALRVADQNFSIAGKTFRYTIDTRLSLFTVGNSSNDIIATVAVPQKNTDNVGDGEVWFDSMPDSKGDYQRTYFRLYQ